MSEQYMRCGKRSGAAVRDVSACGASISPLYVISCHKESKFDIDPFASTTARAAYYCGSPGLPWPTLDLDKTTKLLVKFSQ